MFVAVLMMLLFAERASGSNTSVTLYKRINDFPEVPPARDCFPGSNLRGHGFKHFEWISNIHMAPTDRLARSGAPHYECNDSDQELTDESIQFLKEKDIDNIISVNFEANSPAIKDKLRANGIQYTPLPVKDMASPSLEQIMQAYLAFRSATRGATLVWCGFGHGRSGVIVTAFEMLRAAELQLHHYFNDVDYRKRHIESARQIRTLEKLQDFLIPSYVGLQAGKVKPHADDTQATVKELAAAEEKSSSQLRTVQTELQDVISSLHDLDAALDIQWHLDRVWLDKSLELLSKTQLTEPPSPQALMDSFNDVQDEIGTLIGEQASITDFSYYIPTAADSIKELMRKLKVAARLSLARSKSQKGVTPGQTDLTAQIYAIEDYRKKVHDMFDMLHSQVQKIRTAVEISLKESKGPLRIQALNSDLLKKKNTIDGYASKGMSADAITFYAALQQCEEIANDALETAWTMAKEINDDEELSIQDFSGARRILHEIRIKFAELMAFQAKKYTSNYIKLQWQKEPGSNIDAQQEAHDLQDMAAQIIKPATEIGAYLQDRITTANIISNIFAFAKKNTGSQMIEHDARVGVTTTGTLWLQNKETAKEALHHELDSLMEEISVMKGPTSVLITVASLALQDAQFAQAVFLNVDEAQMDVITWRKEAIREVIDAMDKQLQNEKEQKQELERKEQTEAEGQRLVGDRDKNWKIELAVEIGLAALAAVPKLTTPISEAILWARQAIRIVRFLRNEMRGTVQVAEDLTTEANQVSTQLTDTLKEWKLAAPAATREWAKSKTPAQVIQGLVELKNSGVKPTKPIDELIEELEAIDVPVTVPGNEEDDGHIEKLLEKLESIRVPIGIPKQTRLPELAHLRAPRDYQALRQALRWAASIPHHSSDVEFKKLIEEAAAYLPTDCDIKRTSKAFAIVGQIRRDAVAAA
ncbi:hypothetical protein CDD81_5233 [Ophiocordyceps australis]|uniref:Swiss Army Knife protein DSP-PTPase phosphatase domain-containing protein n=1 Tax=Ophiocordyceps australis TaxID=1399860 RepID=A0A2C5YJ05_9HYPO|nr:hypothetical protein CDD81_5233 [Ophiocordyceps australis]